MTSRRLLESGQDAGGHIDRRKPLGFTFNGRTLEGFEGDTLASALLANDVAVVGRGFKYHRPRGVMSAGAEEGGALLTLGEGSRRVPNVKAPLVELYDGLSARGQNAWPSVERDIGAVNSALSRFFGAGFYYKTFMGPKTLFGKPLGTKVWMQFEKLIRRAAGMGAASREADPDRYEIAHAYCDVLVVGGGIAGLTAAKTAADAGFDVMLCEQDFLMGGAMLGNSGQEVERTTAVSLAEKAGVRLMSKTQVFGLYDGNVAGAVETVSEAAEAPLRERLWIIRPVRVILATGAIERVFAFANNDLPGMMNADALRLYAGRFGVLAGERPVIATNNDSGYEAAAVLAAAGATVTLLDARSTGPTGSVGVEVIRGVIPLAAKGRKRVSALTYGTEAGQVIGTLECDVVGVSGGWNPAIHLASHRGARPSWQEMIAAFTMPEPSAGVHICGAAAGLMQHGNCLTDAKATAVDVIRAVQGTPSAARHPEPGDWDYPIKPLYETPGKGKAFVDPQHDVTTDDIRLAQREGFVSVEHMKRYTTLGMATDQGKVGNIIGLALMAEAQGQTIPETGTTTFRPPYNPVSLGVLAGRSRAGHFRPTRHVPAHDWHQENGAVDTEAGLWLRPWYYPEGDEDVNAAYIREMSITRSTLGLSDVSSLGKIMVQGPDAAEFLNRVYVNGFAKLPVGKARYGVMLRDDGIVYDDGTTWRLSETDYLMTTTTTGAGKVMSWLEELLEVRWPELKVRLTSVSDQWSGVAVAGPKARNLLAAVTDMDMSPEAFPFMAVRDGNLGPIPCRVARISFSGELAYELYVEADYAASAWQLLWDAAEPMGGCLYGLEALGAMRVEKGHVAGQELDGRTTLDDLGLGRMASTKKAFIGKVMMQREGLEDPERAKLVGLRPTVEGQRIRGGAILCPPGEVEGHGVGWITATTYSPSLGSYVALGLVQGGLERWGGRKIVAADPVRGTEYELEVISPHMFDPENERLLA